MATTPTLSDVLYALKITTGKQPFDAKYDVNGDGSVNTADVMGLQKAYLGKDPGFAFAGDGFLSPFSKTAEEYAAENQANQERIAAEQKETERRQTLLADAQKIYGNVTPELVANNPNLTPQQLASLATKNYWSNESEAFSRVMAGMETGKTKLETQSLGTDEFGNEMTRLVLTTKENPGYDTIELRPTSQPGVYQFGTPNQVAGGTIQGVIQADPAKGTYTPIQDYTKQVVYTPGQSGSVLGGLAGSLGDIIKELGPIATVVGNAIAPGLGTVLSVATAIDEGASAADIAKTIAIAEGVNQLGVSSDVSQATGSQAAGQVAAGTVQGLLSGQNLEDALTSGLKSVRPVNDFEAEVNQVLDLPATQETLISGQDLAADNITGNTVQDVITNLVNNIAMDTLVSGQDLAADSITGNTLQDVITTLVNTGTDTLVSGQDLAADSITGNTLQDIVNVLNQDTVLSGQDLASDLGTGTANTLEDISNALAGEGSLISGQDLASDLGTGTANTLEDISIALATEGSDISGQDLAADNTAGNTLTDIGNVLTTNNDTVGTVDDVIKTLSDVAKVASVVGVADSVLNNETQPTQKTGFDIVPVPTDWKSPVYDQSFTPIDLNSILDNINRLQNTQWATPRTYGGAYMGTPVNISDIVNQIMGTELTQQSMPSNITNAVGGILGSSTTR